ncbi:Type I restriction endonuclease subunit M [Vibrio crassostreae]|uniref:type I restriction endonuclease subunit M n=1 Tax=Vibrio sp. SG41-7 TaxID=2760973 RepID=UPI0016020051|nr:type I restriction endonuclease subunit M [Vibrio sp. SG41-7]MBB1466270.1 type I restriction endonuclease subunit M [Vibrio sp. SG41-7]CAK3560803.1 Type I restriction endonuclease subunit M [Vibrio crassostreae]
MNIKNVTSGDEETKEKNYFCTTVPFDLGKVVCTQGIAELLNNNIGVNLPIYLHRYQNGDWGNVCVEDKLTNDEATKTGERVLSSYTICNEQVWIITERDRSCTTILLLNEY